MTAGAPATDRRALGGSDVRVTRLGLGCAPLGNLFTAVDDDTAVATVDAAWDAGARLLDVAPHYGLGLAEARLGMALRDRPRAEVVVSTKVGRVLDPVPGPATGGAAGRDDSMFDVPRTAVRRWDFSARGVMASLEASLERMGLDRVDVLLLHDPDDHLEQAVAEAAPVLAALREQGVVGAIGAGMNTAEPLTRLVEACDLDVVLLAGRYSLLDQSALAELLPTCERRGTSVLVGGVFSSGILATDRPAADARHDYTLADATVRARATAIAEVCERHGATLPQAALHLPLGHPAVAGVVVGCRSPEEVRRNAALLDRAVPDALWEELVGRGLLRDDVPVGRS